MADMAGTVVMAVMVEVIVNEARMKEKETIASSARAPAGIRTEADASLEVGSLIAPTLRVGKERNDESQAGVNRASVAQAL